jgi:glycine betaine transporter
MRVSVVEEMVFVERERAARIGPVFYVSLALALGFAGWGVLSRDSLTRVTEVLLGAVLETFGLVYLVVVLAVLLFVLFLGLSPIGKVRLGGDGERPDFGRVSWVAMLFSAGVGLSFLFWGTAQPLMHLAEPPYAEVQAGSEEAGRLGMRYSFLFWGLHAWAVYAAVAIAVAYVSFRKGRPVLISSALHPLLGDRVNGPLGKTVDVLSVLAILFGVSTSLGLGTRELNSVLGLSFGVPQLYYVKVAIIAGLMTACAISAATGLGRGIRVLSLLNAGVCGALLVFVLVFGPTLFLLTNLAESIGGYVSSIVPMSVRSGSSARGGWEEDWTFFFWAWWISWSPFVGTFIARISRGRTIREVVVGMVLVPSAVSFVWFSVFGGISLQLQLTGQKSLAELAGDSKALVTFEVFETLPIPGVVSGLIILVIGLLFITSADSASFMLGSTTCGGSLYPPKLIRLLWSGLGGFFAAVLLLDSGTRSLQGAAVVGAVPFTVILVLLCVALAKSLLQEPREKRGARAATGPRERSEAGGAPRGSL